MSTQPTFTTPPTRIIAGDTAAFTYTAPGFSAADGGTLSFALAGPTTLAVTGVANGVAWDVALTAAQTTALTSGNYQWRIRITEAATVTTVDTGTLEVTPDLATLTGDEAMSWEARTLPIVEAALEGTLDGAMKMYMIAGRQVMSFTPKELMALRASLKAVVAFENGGGFGTGIIYTYRGAGR